MSHDQFDQSFDGFDDSPVQPKRAPAKRRAAKTMAEEAVNLAKVESEFPEIAKWWKNSTFAFALSLKQAARTWGSLTQGQVDAALKCARKFDGIKEANERRAAEAPALEMSEVCAAFGRGVGVLRLAFGGRQFKLSEAKTKWNKGFVFVNRDDLYLGKLSLADGKFLQSADCSDDDVEMLAGALGDVEKCAVAYGRLTNRCSCCGRQLENAESVALGIGPICRGKFFG